MVTIASVEKGSICEKLGIRAGDILVSINSYEIYDILDYRFRLCEKKIKLSVLRDGKVKNYRFRKDETDIDIGLEFATALMDESSPAKTNASSASSTRIRRACASHAISRTTIPASPSSTAITSHSQISASARSSA